MAGGRVIRSLLAALRHQYRYDRERTALARNCMCRNCFECIAGLHRDCPRRCGDT
jgi:hypothetical protein